jgi:cell division protein FtsQ
VNTKATIKKILFILLWICIGGGMLTLMVAAIGKKNRENCSGYSISIKGSREFLFVDENDIARLLTTALGTDIKGEKITDFNLKRLEQLLKDNVWIRDAEMWFDNNNLLHIAMYEREPVARIFTTTGHSFYIDSSETVLPLSEKMTARIPMFTGFPDKKIYNAEDSALLKDIKNIAMFVGSDDFWNSQLAQIDILSDKNYSTPVFDLSPVVGNHLIRFGDGKNIEKKFSRLMTFYKKVLAQQGMDAYRTIDVQYAGQVVGTRKGTEKNKVDTVMLKKNVEAMLKQVQKQYDSIAAIKPVIEKPIITGGSSEVSTKDGRATNPQSANPNAMKAQSLPGKNNEKPKAVMQKKSGG